MNEEERHNPEFRLRISLEDLSHNEWELSIDRLMEVLETTKSLKEMEIYFKTYQPTPENNRRIVDPLCRCIANLRRHNENHPLGQLKFYLPHIREDIVNGLLGVSEQFLVAAKQSGIVHLVFLKGGRIPVQFLEEFCRDNRSLKVLELHLVDFFDARSIVDQPQDPSLMLHLDKLRLSWVSFENPAAATNFAIVVKHFKVSHLSLGKIHARAHLDVSADTDRIVSEFKMPAVERLTLEQFIQFGHFRNALEAGTRTVTKLTVEDLGRLGDRETTAKLELLLSMAGHAAKLKCLTIKISRYVNHVGKPTPLFGGLDACATVTRIQLLDHQSQRDIQQARRIVDRNLELDCFLTSPGTYPTYKLLILMSQFANCPTGRYKLATRLPGIFSFDKISKSINDSSAALKEKKQNLGSLPIQASNADVKSS